MAVKVFKDKTNGDYILYTGNKDLGKVYNRVLTHIVTVTGHPSIGTMGPNTYMWRGYHNKNKLNQFKTE